MFQIILTSDTPTNNYLDYDPGCFRADLSETLNLNFGQLSWEVALSELFIYPKSWHIIREPFNFFQFSVENFLYEPFEKRFYRAWGIYEVKEDDPRAEAGNSEVRVGETYYGEHTSYFSWSTFRGHMIIYKELPDPGIPHDKYI